MTEKEICLMYREAKNKDIQLNILAELNDVNRNEIIRILVKNGNELSQRVINQMYKRLDVLDMQISERQKEYREIVRALNGAGGKEMDRGLTFSLETGKWGLKENVNGEGWIPCMEKLPPEPDGNMEPMTAQELEQLIEGGILKEYLVTISGADASTTMYYAGNGEWYDMLTQEYYPVAAWMPMPGGFCQNMGDSSI